MIPVSNNTTKINACNLNAIGDDLPSIFLQRY